MIIKLKKSKFSNGSYLYEDKNGLLQNVDVYKWNHTGGVTMVKMKNNFENGLSIDISYDENKK